MAAAATLLATVLLALVSTTSAQELASGDRNGGDVGELVRKLVAEQTQTLFTHFEERVTELKRENQELQHRLLFEAERRAGHWGARSSPGAEGRDSEGLRTEAESKGKPAAESSAQSQEIIRLLASALSARTEAESKGKNAESSTQSQEIIRLLASALSEKSKDQGNAAKPDKPYRHPLESVEDFVRDMVQLEALVGELGSESSGTHKGKDRKPSWRPSRRGSSRERSPEIHRLVNESLLSLGLAPEEDQDGDLVFRDGLTQEKKCVVMVNGRGGMLVVSAKVPQMSQAEALSFANSWNIDKRWTKAAFKKEMAAMVLEMDFDFEQVKTPSQDQMEHFIDIFRHSVAFFLLELQKALQPH